MSSQLFLKIDTVAGESLDERHRDEIELVSWRWGEENAVQRGAVGGGAGRGRVTLQDFHFTHLVDKSSPQLMMLCATGRHVSTAVLTVRRAGDQPLEYLTVRLQDAVVSSVELGGSTGDDRFLESVALSVTAVGVDYRQQLPDGSLGAPSTFDWDQARNR